MCCLALFAPCLCCAACAGSRAAGKAVDGAASLRVWTLEGVAVTVHDALDADYAKDFQKPGFSK